jgi:hypothetical protein
MKVCNVLYGNAGAVPFAGVPREWSTKVIVSKPTRYGGWTAGKLSGGSVVGVATVLRVVGVASLGVVVVAFLVVEQAATPRLKTTKKMASSRRLTSGRLWITVAQ